MPRIPKKVKEFIDKTLSVYIENESLELFDILHLYDTGKYGIVKDDGYHDAKHFDLVGYNIELKQFRKLGRHDAIQLNSRHSVDCPIDSVRIFLDGSTLIKFKRPIPFIHTTQKVYYAFSEDKGMYFNEN